MSEYRRLVSYLYSYNKGSKVKNVGFIKAERRGGIIKLLVNLKGAFVEEEKLQVYFFVRRNDMIVGTELGEIGIRGGSSEFKAVCNESEIGTVFEEISGIYIKGGTLDNLFASQWDDLDFSVDKIIEIKDFVDKTDESEELLAENENSDDEDNVEIEKIAPKINIWEMPIKEEIYVQELGADLAENASVSDENVVDSDENATDSEPEARPQNTWDELFTSRTRVDLFSDDEIYDCVEITPADILKLPSVAERVMSNSFLNHGFFNFHHLILGRKYNASSENGLVLGVPGVYNRREKMTANMFGFEKFKFSMRSDVRMPHFGYWYKEY